MRNGSTAKQNPEGKGLPVTRIETISTGQIDYSRVGHVFGAPAGMDKYKLLPGDVLLSHINSVRHIGKVAQYNGEQPLYHGMNLMLLRWDTGTVDRDFGYQVLTSARSKQYFERHCKQAINQASLNMKDLGAMEFLLPPLPEQRKIAAILSSVDEVIEKTEAVIEQLQVVKKAMMRELLTRGLPGRHTRFKQTEIGEIPEEWEVVALAEVLESGPTNGRSPKSSAKPPGVPTFSIAAVRNGVVDIGSHLKYAAGKASEVGRFEVSVGDVLIVRGNGNPELMGRAGQVFEVPVQGCIYPDLLMRVRRNDRIAPGLLVQLWNTDLVHDQLLLKAKTTNGIYKVNGKDLASTLLPLPSAAEQERIVEGGQVLDARLTVEQQTLGRLRSAKSALMSVLLTGEIRVTPDNEPA